MSMKNRTPSKFTGVSQGARSSSITSTTRGSLRTTDTDLFNLEDFSTAAKDTKITREFLGQQKQEYTKAVKELEEAIRKKNTTSYSNSETALGKLIRSKVSNMHFNKLDATFKDLKAHVKKGKDRGDWFQFIKIEDDTPRRPTPAPSSADDKTKRTKEQADVMEKLLEIEKIFEDDQTQESGTKVKKASNRSMDDVLTAIKANEERHTKQANQLLSTIMSAKEIDKMINQSDKNDLESLLDICISELKKQVDAFYNQIKRLDDISTKLESANDSLCIDKKKSQDKKKKDKENTTSHDFLDLQIKSQIALFQSKLSRLEKEVHSTEENVQKVDEEVEELEKDLEDWNKTETINELKNVDKCSLGALRSARLALYKHKKAQKEKGNAGDTKKLNEAIKKLCTDNGISESKTKEDKSSAMLKELDEHLKNEKKMLKALQDTLQKLHDENDSKGKRSTTPKANIDINALIKLAQDAHEEQTKLRKGRRDVEESLKEKNDAVLQFSKTTGQELDIVSNTLTSDQKIDEQIPQTLQELPEELKQCLVKVLRIKRISEQSLNQVKKCFEIIMGKEYQFPVQHSNKQDSDEKNEQRDCIDGRMQILIKEVNAKSITRDYVSKLKKEDAKKMGEIDDIKLEVKRLKHDVSYWTKKAEREEKEKAEYMNRLSKVASAKLMENNPNIADLSDSNRQTKLAEKYSELYDNEWTNAFEECERSKQFDTEEEIIKYILKILMDVYKTCSHVRTEQITGMKRAILQPAQFFCLAHESRHAKEDEHEDENKDNEKETREQKKKTSTKPTKSKSSAGGESDTGGELDVLQIQAITDLRKQTTTQAISDLTKYYKSKNLEWFNGKDLAEFTTKCIELCWYMNIHSPPVYLDNSVKPDAKFDKNMYKHYTRSGKKVKFVVWPAIFLHENGSTLGKGVAQGTD